MALPPSFRIHLCLPAWLAGLAVVVGLGIGEVQAQQDQSQPGTIQSFENVTVERIRPDQLPDFRPGLPQGIQSRGLDDLPRALTSGDLDALSATLEEATIPLIAVQMPPRPYRQVEMVYQGHALWIDSGLDDQPPFLITTADWIDQADALFLLPPEPSTSPRRRTQIPTAQLDHTGLGETITDGRRFLQRHTDRLVPVEVLARDPQVNLAHLQILDPDRLSPPSTGLRLHSMEHTLPASLFSYSALQDSTVTPVRVLLDQTIPEEYAFYFLTDTPSILGAPLVGADGRLIAISALRFPLDPTLTLMIPPGALHFFVANQQDLLATPPNGDDDDTP